MILRRPPQPKKKAVTAKIGYLLAYSLFWLGVFVVVSGSMPSGDSGASVNEGKFAQAVKETNTRSFSSGLGSTGTNKVEELDRKVLAIAKQKADAEAEALIKNLEDPPPRDGAYAVTFQADGAEHVAVYAAGTLIVVKSGLHYSSAYPLPPRIYQNFTIGHEALARRGSGTRYFNYPTPSPDYPFLLLGERPAILYFPRILSDKECDDVIGMARPKLFRSQVMRKVGDNESSVSDIRTSHQTWLEDTINPTTEKIATRLRSVVGIRTAEATQILHYQQGQKYLAHHDYFDPEIYGRQTDNRAATFFLYLSTLPPFAGGDTYFPRAFGLPPLHYGEDVANCSRGLRVFPKKGSGALFFDQLPDGRLDPTSLHGSCPIQREGVEKWGGTKWFRTSTSLMGPERLAWE